MRWLWVIVFVGLASASPGHDPSTGSPILPGESAEVVLDEPGVVEYYCEPHPWMTGSILVEPREGDPEQHVIEVFEQGSEWGFSPATITIRAGDSVVWNNTGSTMHQISWTHTPEDNPKGAVAWISVGAVLGIAGAFVVNRRLA